MQGGLLDPMLFSANLDLFYGPLIIYRTGYFYGAATNHLGLGLVLVGLSLGVNTSFKTKQGLRRTRKLRQCTNWKAKTKKCAKKGNFWAIPFVKLAES